MGRSGPLEHPELRDVEALLEHHDVAEAQRLLARLGTRSDLADGIAYLSTRVLYARGRLDLPGVADRLRDLLARSPDFPEAASFLERALSGAPISRPATVLSAPPTVRASPKAPEPPDDSDRTEPHFFGGGSFSSATDATLLDLTAQPGQRDLSGGAPTGNADLDTVVNPVFPTSVNDRPPTSKPAERSRNRIPNIPRAPALPQFHDNSAPPSYAPHRLETEMDARRSKSLLPQNAGRYSEAPRDPDVVGRGAGRPSHGPRSHTPQTERRGRETVPGVPDRIRSGQPEHAAALPSLFEIASWIDEGRHRDAIKAINRAGADAGLEYAVLRARALAGAGYRDQALDALEKLDALPHLDPELRAASARLYVELGDPARALRLARRALDADPDRPLIRLTYALAVVRVVRRRPDDELLDQADRTLERLHGREGPLPALLQALKACIQATSGDAERAISIAQRALGLEPTSLDALAAIAEASARLGRTDDARQAWTRLSAISTDEGEVVAAALARMGLIVAPGRGEARGAFSAEAAPWAPVELELVSGNRAAAIALVEHAAEDVVRRIVKSASQSGITPIASVAASFLTTTPVLSSFAPFDMSLFGVRRLEAALDVLYGTDRRVRVPKNDAALVLLLGAYLGETVRLAHGGRWEGSIAELDSARVVAGEHRWHPFRIVMARLHQGRRAALGAAVRDALDEHSREPWRARIPNPVCPPVPWSPEAWPPPSQIGTLGRALSRSPIGKYCEDFAEGPLDNTTASLIALDTYLELVAPPTAVTEFDSAWTRRVSVFAGGYVGETLRELVGGEWIYGVDGATDAQGYKLQLRGTLEAFPVAHVLERVIGERSSSLVDYAKTLMRRVARG